jgi:hypothetical protein
MASLKFEFSLLFFLLVIPASPSAAENARAELPASTNMHQYRT